MPGLVLAATGDKTSYKSRRRRRRRRRRRVTVVKQGMNSRPHLLYQKQ
jgi:hypothetical protein